MKAQLNKKKFSRIKFNKYKIFYSTFLILSFLLFFLLGTWSEKYDFNKKVKLFLNDLSETIANRVYSNFYDIDKLVIDMNYKNYQKILETRQESLKSFRSNEDLHKWVSASLNYNNKDYKIQAKLKGVHEDHWKHPLKWSFKIKLDEDRNEKKTLFNLKRFSLQHAKTRGYLHEWLLMKVLKEEGLIAHRTKFVNFVMNGNNLGIYNLEEQHSKELLEFNNRREGPIVGFDKNLWVTEANNINKLGVNRLRGSFWRSEIKPVQFNEKNKNTEQGIYLNEAITLLESFRQNSRDLSEIFDLEQFSKLLAAKAVLGSIEFDWRDIKFYYNPVTKLLEPIGREIHVDLNQSQINTWWIDLSSINFAHSPDQKYFLSLLFKNKTFFKKYLNDLSRMSKKNYVRQIISNNYEEFKKYENALKQNYPRQDIFSLEYIERYRNEIEKTLNPIQGINLNYISSEKNSLTLNVSNLQRLPIEIIGFQENQKDLVFLKKSIYLQGKLLNKAIKPELVRIDCTTEDACKKDNLENLKIIYKILGQNKNRESRIAFWSNTIESYMSDLYDKPDQNFKKQTYLKIENNEIIFNSGLIEINKPLYIPANYKVIFNPGTEIIFSQEGHIISGSPVFFKGLSEKPITVRSDFDGNIKSFRIGNLDQNNQKLKFGYGIAVINTNEVSVINNTIFHRMSAPTQLSGLGLLGSINFYQSDVRIKNSKFSENLLGDDYLNIIRSNFVIENCLFQNVNSDAVDIDFSKGIMTKLSFKDTGNDALDFSGSNVQLRDIIIHGAGDKAISVGEKSKIDIENVTIFNSVTGIASKDNSEVEANKININNTQYGIVSYMKKNEYGPSKINLNDILITNSEEKYLVEKGSSIKVNNNDIPFKDFDFKIFIN
jgi:hypothetical protein